MYECRIRSPLRLLRHELLLLLMLLLIEKDLSLLLFTKVMLLLQKLLLLLRGHLSLKRRASLSHLTISLSAHSGIASVESNGDRTIDTHAHAHVLC